MSGSNSAVRLIKCRRSKARYCTGQGRSENAARRPIGLTILGEHGQLVDRSEQGGRA